MARAARITWELTVVNAKRTIKALGEFGYDLIDLRPEDFLENKILIRQYQVEADFHPFVKGVVFETEIIQGSKSLLILRPWP